MTFNEQCLAGYASGLWWMFLLRRLAEAVGKDGMLVGRNLIMPGWRNWQSCNRLIFTNRRPGTDLSRLITLNGRDHARYE